MASLQRWHRGMSDGIDDISDAIAAAMRKS
jgi:hypothetical protein